MNRAMADKMIGIIQTDATHKGRMFHQDGGMCALGGLYAAAVRKTGQELYTEALSGEKTYYHDLEVMYNINQWSVQQIYETNDSFDDLTERRAALTKLINSWVKE